jgi:hypothetical protein
MAAPKDWLGQDFGVRGDFLTHIGDIKTREHNATGGGSLIGRHVYAGGSAGGFHIEVASPGTGNDFSIMPDGSPASNINFQVNGDSITFGSVEIATGKLTLLSLITDIDAGVTFGDGSPNSGVALATSSEARSKVNMGFTALGWEIVTDVGQPLRVQILKQSQASYDNSTWVDVSGTSTSTGGMPRIGIGGGVKASSSDIHLWPATTFNRGDIIRAVVTNNAGVNGWYSLQIYGYRNVKKT